MNTHPKTGLSLWDKIEIAGLGLLATGIVAISAWATYPIYRQSTLSESPEVTIPMSAEVCAQQIAPDIKDYLKKTRVYADWTPGYSSNYPFLERLEEEALNCKEYVFESADLESAVKEKLGFEIYIAGDTGDFGDSDTRYIAIPNFSSWSRSQFKDVTDWTNFRTRMSKIETMATDIYCSANDPDTDDNYYATKNKILPILEENAPSWQTDKPGFADLYWSNNIHCKLIEIDCSKLK